MKSITLNDIQIRTHLKAGDLGYITYLHGKIYMEEYQFGTGIETYVARGLADFYDSYNPEKERVWLCEYDEKVIGSMVLVCRGEVAQLRYFILEKEFRGIGLGKKLMDAFMEALRQIGYKSAYLLTTDGLPASAHLYQRYGFRLVEEHSFDGFGKVQHEQRYELHLESSMG
jgi:N-acetylglutamate synthase-like GNAT family acetyltransferase